MMSIKLHVISFDIPYPADYGGVIDVFYKLKALREKGVDVILHCFEYGRQPRSELNKYCHEVYYYPRRAAKSLLFNTYPYIVLSRNSPELKDRLLLDDYPVLMEGLHSTFLINDPAFAGRNIIVRAHNKEHDYYSGLAKVERNVFKKYYFYNEAGKLLKYEQCLKKAAGIASISPSESVHFKSINPNTEYIPAFHPFDEVKIPGGKGSFAFYHGNLSVGENNEAAVYLINEIFNDLPYRLVVAGNKPSPALRKAAKQFPNIELMDNLAPGQILKMISEAQCNVLPTFQSTGIKLKLLASLFSGRTCIVNTPMVKDTGLESLCIIADTVAEMKDSVKKIMQNGVDVDSLLQERKKILGQDFSNDKNADKLIKMFLR
jgi:hypothetical protein